MRRFLCLALIAALILGCRPPAPVRESEVLRACGGAGNVVAIETAGIIQLTFAIPEENRALVLRFEPFGPEGQGAGSARAEELREAA